MQTRRDSRTQTAVSVKHEEMLNRNQARKFLDRVVARDYYWDSLVRQEAISQADWACSKNHKGRVCLFRGSLAVICEKLATALGSF
jgi:hypothetical protein